MSYSASVRYREVHGDQAAEELLDQCMDKIKQILGKPQLALDEIELEVMNEFFMVLSTNKKN